LVHTSSNLVELADVLLAVLGAVHGLNHLIHSG
jgi:hypothetical protein